MIAPPSPSQIPPATKPSRLAANWAIAPLALPLAALLLLVWILSMAKAVPVLLRAQPVSATIVATGRAMQTESGERRSRGSVRQTQHEVAIGSVRYRCQTPAGERWASDFRPGEKRLRAAFAFEVDGFLARFPEGQACTAWYDPRDPERIFLLRAVPGGSFAPLYVAMLVLAFPLLGAMGRRGWGWPRVGWVFGGLWLTAPLLALAIMAWAGDVVWPLAMGWLALGLYALVGVGILVIAKRTIAADARAAGA